MAVAVLSDLHLGTRVHVDVLRNRDVRHALLATLEEVDDVVLLGDVIELRHGPVADAIADARPFFEDLGEALAGRRITLVPGNHDHHLAAPLLERRRLEGPSKPLGLERITGPGRTGPVARIARLMPGAELTLAYPGLWVRPDVYATHGHYLDCHHTVPRLESLGVAVIERLIGGLPQNGRTPDAYEMVLSPLYSFTYDLAQATSTSGRVPGGDLSLKVWGRLNARGGLAGLKRRVLGGVLVPGAVAALNRAGLGPFGRDLSGHALRRAGLLAMTEVVERLAIEADVVVFGHTHRSGPDEEAEKDWELADGRRLMNAGNWLYEPSLLGPSAQESPYWPGTLIFVPDEGPPELRRLLADRSHDELARARS